MWIGTVEIKNKSSSTRDSVSKAKQSVKYINASIVLYQLLMNIEDTFVIEDANDQYTNISELLFYVEDDNAVKDIISDHLYNKYTYFLFF